MLVTCLTHRPVFSQASKIIDHNCIDLSKIPLEYINAAKSNLDIYFGHKSHGAHVTGGGMQAIINYSAQYEDLYPYNSSGSGGALKIFEEPQYPPEDNWESSVRSYLDAHTSCNTVLWGWSYSAVTQNTGLENAQNFLVALESLMDDYPSVTFVLSTPPPYSRYPNPDDFDSKPYDKYDHGSFSVRFIVEKICHRQRFVALRLLRPFYTRPRWQQLRIHERRFYFR
ncbi:MAG: hypothetical protein HC896_16990 [Bacteroidales bacterium]|nr:hypothetical protein [Bacteroidales bacterium]